MASLKYAVRRPLPHRLLLAGGTPLSRSNGPPLTSLTGTIALRGGDLPPGTDRNGIVAWMADAAVFASVVSISVILETRCSDAYSP